MYSTSQQKYRRLQTEIIAGGLSLAGVFAIGTLWYALVEGWSWSDAAYMTVITLTTVGYGEIHPMGHRARLFTIALIFLGVISIGYIVNRLTEALIEGYFQEGIKRRQFHRLLDSLNSHYILCGFGRTGQQIALEFEAEGISFIVIDLDPESIKEAQELNCVVLQGDATLDEILLTAKIEQAVCLVAALPSDAENLYTVLSAKTLNPHIRAIARASSEEAIQKLQRGGADAVVSPYITGGRRMATAALRPEVMHFVDGMITGKNRSFYMEEFLIDPQICPFLGQSLRETNLRSQTGALVLAIRRYDGTLLGGPTGETLLQAGDLLICMGTAEQLRRLHHLLGPLSSRFRS